MSKFYEIKNLRNSQNKNEEEGNLIDNKINNINTNQMNSLNNSKNDIIHGEGLQLDTSKNNIPNNKILNMSSNSFKQNKSHSKIQINMNSDNDNDNDDDYNKHKTKEAIHNKNNFKDPSSSDNHESENKIQVDTSAQNSNQKIFMTDYKLANFDNKDFFTFHDLIIPGGKNAKLCLVNDPFNKNIRVTEIADHFKFYEPKPTIVLIGANTKRKGKLFAGLSRAALNTRAVIIDSGLQTGLEPFCIRKNLSLVGIAPQKMVEYPIPNPEEFSSKMLTNGHTHFILLGDEKNKLNWGEEYKFKLSFAERLASGRKGYPYKSKIVGVILGNIPNCENEISYFIEKNLPLILIEDSELSQNIKTAFNGEEFDKTNSAVKDNLLIEKVSKYSKLIEIEDDSENLASAVHLCLTISI